MDAPFQQNIPFRILSTNPTYSEVAVVDISVFSVDISTNNVELFMKYTYVTVVDSSLFIVDMSTNYVNLTSIIKMLH